MQQPDCNCHDCTQARYKASFAGQLEAAGITGEIDTLRGQLAQSEARLLTADAEIQHLRFSVSLLRKLDDQRSAALRRRDGSALSPQLEALAFEVMVRIKITRCMGQNWSDAHSKGTPAEFFNAFLAEMTPMAPTYPPAYFGCNG